MTSGPPTSEDLVPLLRSGSAPREIRLFAARGLLPLEPDDGIRALLAVVGDPDSDCAGTARETLRKVAPDRLAAFAKTGKPLAAELDVLARESDDPFVLEEVVRSRAISDATLLHLAMTATGRPQEAIIANQSRLLAQPSLVPALLANPGLSSEGRRLLAEFREEFLEKGRSRSRDDRAGPETAALPEEADALEDEAEADDGEEADADTTSSPEGVGGSTEEESLYIGAVFRRIALMTVPEKIDLAYKGSREERRILIGDTNKLIGIAVLKSRALTDTEVEGFAAMRNLDEELYRRIAANREWMRRPAVSLALVRNPRAPLDVSLPLLKRLSVRELRAVFRDRNLAPVIRTSARRILVEKRR